MVTGGNGGSILFISSVMSFLPFPTSLAYSSAKAAMNHMAAIIALVGAIDAPIIYWAANLWAEAHPPLVIGPARDEDSALSGDIGLTLLAGVVAFTLVFAVILVERYRIRRAEDDVTALRRTLQVTGADAT